MPSIFRRASNTPGGVYERPQIAFSSGSGSGLPSMSVAVIAEVPSRNEVLLNLLAWHLHQSPEGRARAYGGWSDDPSAAQQGLADLAQALAEHMPGLDTAFDTWQLDRSLGKPTLTPGAASFRRFIRLAFAHLSMHTMNDDEGLLIRVGCGSLTQSTKL